MLKPLKTEYRGRHVVLECTHKRTFPPPQVYGATDDDIDNLWRQGAISQNEHQLLQTWRDKCHLIVMGPRCLDCPLALLQKPRPGRPNVIETEPWLAAKERMRWDDMKAGISREGFYKTSEALTPSVTVEIDLGEEDAPSPSETKKEEEEEETSEDPNVGLGFLSSEEDTGSDSEDSVSIDDDVLDALAED